MKKISHLLQRNSRFYPVASKQVGDFFQIFVAFSKKLDFNMDHVARGAKYGNFGVLYEKEIIIRL